MLDREQIGQSPELMVAGREGNAFGRKHRLEQLLRRLFEGERAVPWVCGKKLAGDGQILLRQCNEAGDRRLHAAGSALRQRRSR